MADTDKSISNLRYNQPIQYSITGGTYVSSVYSVYLTLERLS